MTILIVLYYPISNLIVSQIYYTLSPVQFGVINFKYYYKLLTNILVYDIIFYTRFFLNTVAPKIISLRPYVNFYYVN